MKYLNDKIVYEVGDYVVQTQDFAIFPIDYKAHKITKFKEDGYFYIDNELNFGFTSDTFRPATQEEIKDINSTFKEGDWVVVVNECLKSTSGKKLMGLTLKLKKCLHDGYVNVIIPSGIDFRNSD